MTTIQKFRTEAHNKRNRFLSALRMSLGALAIAVGLQVRMTVLRLHMDTPKGHIVDPDDLAPGECVFGLFRHDGWPLCPRCGTDHLHSELEKSGTSYQAEARLYLHILSGMKCLACTWELLPGLNWGGF